MPTSTLPPTVGSHGSSIKWTSNDPAVFQHRRNHHARPRHLRIGHSDYGQRRLFYSRTISFTVKGGGLSGADYATGLMASTTSTTTLSISIFHRQWGTAGALTSGTNPGYEANSTLGNTVWHQYFGYADAQNHQLHLSAIHYPGETGGCHGINVVYRLDSDAGCPMVILFRHIQQHHGPALPHRQHHLGYNGLGGWFDCNSPSSSSSSIIPPSTWTLVAISFSSKGFSIYTNGDWPPARRLRDFTSDNGFSGYQAVLDQMSSASSFYLGCWLVLGSAPALFDDLLIYNRALSGPMWPSYTERRPMA